MSDNNNILSYFIKDIKDPDEHAHYIQVAGGDFIMIGYKKKSIFEIDGDHIYNYNLNIYKIRFTKTRSNYKIYTYDNIKHLFYKHDKNIKVGNKNHITFYFIYKKYLVKIDFSYINNNMTLLNNMVKYHNGFKYIITKYKPNHINNKYTNNFILIMNKYELHYYNKFFNLYFGLLN